VKTSSLDEVITQLTSIPKSLKEATGASGLPSEPGLYAWSTVPGAIPDVPHGPHPKFPIETSVSAARRRFKDHAFGHH
jgi:hypothetical protein